MAILGASFLLCVLQCFGVGEGMLAPGACRMTYASASARRIVSRRGLCVSSLCSQIPLAPAPTFGAFRSKTLLVAQTLHQGCRATAVALHLCSIFGLVFSQCRTTVALHPWKGLRKGTVAAASVLLGGGGVAPQAGHVKIINPKNLLRLFFASKIIFIFWGYFQGPS